MIFDIRKHFEKTKFIIEEGTFRSQEGERKRGNLLIGRMGERERRGCLGVGTRSTRLVVISTCNR